MLILVDLDGVLANFESRFLELWREKFPAETSIPLNERRTFDVQEQYGLSVQDKVREIMNAPGFFYSLPPIELGAETVHRLVELGHEILICTSPLSGSKACMQEKYDWVLKYLGQSYASKMVITKDKTMVRGDILIDDRPEVKGRFIPEWEHVLFHAPYNSSVENRRRLNSWAEGVRMFCGPFQPG